MTLATETTGVCAQCGTQLGAMMIACPRCGRLVHGDRLAALAKSARDATDRGDVSAALADWRDALALLPAGSKQYAIIADKITTLGRDVHAAPAPTARSSEGASTARSSIWRTVAGVGAIGLLVWKLKSLLFGLGKASTLLGMFASVGVYWTLWGWPFAVGLVLSIYIHEMGHVIALRRYGFRAGAPMFIPGLGAYIRLQQKIVNPREDAAIGLAGPIYGLGAALFSAGLWAIAREPIFAAIAGIGAWVNLFNLLPFGSLDGGRAFHAMTRTQKVLATLAIAAAWYFTKDGILILIGAVAAFRVFADKPEAEGSWNATITYGGLVGVLTALSLMRLLAPID